jgi:hypothetical protein
MRRLLFPAAALLLASCALGPAARLEVQLPPLPDPWLAAFPRVDCVLGYTDASGETQWLRVEGWKSGTIIECSKEGNTPVLAYPVLPSAPDPPQPGMLRPAGGVFPDAAKACRGALTIELTWKDGAAACVAQELRRAGLDTSLFNMTRLAGVLREKVDPWDFDLGTIVQKIASGDFDVYDIDALALRDVPVDAGAGSWVMESPFRGATVSDAGGVLNLVDVSLGLHAVFSSGGRIVKVEVREREVISSPVPPAGGDRGPAKLPPPP